MALPDTSDYFRYDVRSCRIMFKDGTFRDVLSPEIESINFTCIYRGDLLVPIIDLSIRTDYKSYIRLIQEKETVMIQVEVVYWVHDEMKGEAQSPRIRTWFNKKFDVYIEDGYMDSFRKRRQAFDEEYRSLEDKTADTSVNQQLSVNLFLFDDKIIQKIFATHNNVYEGARPIDMVIDLLQTSGFNNVVMSPPDSSRTFSNFILPPLTFPRAMEFIQESCGLYDTGLSMFFDINLNYILTNKKGHTAYKKSGNASVVIVVRNDDDAKTMMQGSKLVEQEDTVYINVAPDTVEYQQPLMMNSLLLGDRLHAVNPKTANTKTATVRKTRSGRIAYFMDRFNNQKAVSSYKHDMDLTHTIVGVGVDHININWITPNRKFTLHFEDVQAQRLYGGELILLGTQYELMNKSGFFTMKGSMNFAKV